MYYVRNKYSTAKKIRIGDRTYDSKFEGGIANEYILDKATRKIKNFEPQVTLDLICNGYVIGTYRIDFVVYHNDGDVELVEAKGLPSPEWKMKWKVLETMVNTNHQYLVDKFGKGININMTLIKQRSNWQLKNIKKYNN
ncbi:MAG: DUF1064 domain-containing protein [Patescibacteria group bacterium]